MYMYLISCQFTLHTPWHLNALLITTSPTSFLQDTHIWRQGLSFLLQPPSPKIYIHMQQTHNCWITKVYRTNQNILSSVYSHPHFIRVLIPYKVFWYILFSYSCVQSWHQFQGLTPSGFMLIFSISNLYQNEEWSCAYELTHRKVLEPLLVSLLFVDI